MHQSACFNIGCVLHGELRCLVAMVGIDRGEASERATADNTFLINFLIGVGIHRIKVHQIIRDRIEIVGKRYRFGLGVTIHISKCAAGRTEGVVWFVPFGCLRIGIAGAHAVVPDRIAGLQQIGGQFKFAVLNDIVITIFLIVLLAPGIVRKELKVFRGLDCERAGGVESVHIGCAAEGLTEGEPRFAAREV